jgi:hypothetical protein
MNRMLLVVSIAILACGFSASSATAHQKEKGPVTITIQASAAKVKTVLLSQLAPRGFTVESETEHQMIFAKDAEGFMAEFALRVFAGNAYSEKPRTVARFILNEVNGSVTVTGSQEVSARMAFGKVSRISLDEGKNRKGFEAFLEEIKAEAEKNEDEKTEHEP